MMNSQKNYVVKLCMQNYFQDHRASCLSFINTSMKTVGDFKKHVSKIYNINDFYLAKLEDSVLDHIFLPEVEDVRIIKPDDTLLVVPNSPIVDQLIVEELVDIAPKKKTKNRKKRKISDVSTEVLNVDNTPSQEKKKRKAFAEDGLEKECGEHDVNMPSTSALAVSPKKSKKKKSKSRTEQNSDTKLYVEPEIGETSEVLRKRPKMTKDLSSNIIEKSQKVQKICDVADTPREKLIRNITPARNILPSGKLNKSFNIIENIIIRHPDPSRLAVAGPSSSHKGIMDTAQSQCVSETDNTIIELLKVPKSIREDISTKWDIPADEVETIATVASATNANTVESVSNDCHQHSTDLTKDVTQEIQTVAITNENVTCKSHISISDTSLPILNDLESTNVQATTLIATPELAGSPLEYNHVTRRKRTRKRVAKQNHVIDSPMPSPIYSGRKLNVAAKPLIHFCFDNGPIDEIEEQSKTMESSCSVNGDNKSNGKYLHHVNVDNNNRGRVTDLVDTPHIHSKFNGKRMLKEEIKSNNNERYALGKRMSDDTNYPIVDKLENVRFNDVITFQKLKLGPDFNPQLSNRISARIENIDADSQELRLTIFEGIQEFEQPVGKLSMQCDDDFEMGNMTQVLQWRNLVKPQMVSSSKTQSPEREERILL